VSTGKHGPVNPRMYEMRPEATADELPVPEYTVTFVTVSPLDPPDSMRDPAMPR